MTGEVSVGAIGAVDFLRWVPSGDMSGEKRLILSCLYPFLVHIFSQIRV